MSGSRLPAHSEMARWASYVYEAEAYADGGAEFILEDAGEYYILAFRGTSKNGSNGKSRWAFLRDVFHDIRFFPKPSRELGWVPAGFLTLARRVYDDVARLILDKRKPVVITGHSLGAALSLLVGGLLVSRGYTVRKIVGFGCPHTGRIKPLLNGDVQVVLYRHGKDFVTYVSPFLPLHCDPELLDRHEYSENAFTDHGMEFYLELVS